MEVRANLTNANCNWGGMHEVEFIVIHNTANGTDAPGTAYNNTCYFKDAVRNASAHYFVDSGDTVWQCVGEDDRAWHCGDNASRNGCYNYNSIGIEVCETAWGEFSQAERDTLRWLVRDLMVRHGVDASHVVRHFDVTGKRCPWLYADNGDLWEELHAYITAEGEQEEDMALSQDDLNSIFYDNWGYKNKSINGDKDAYCLLTEAAKDSAAALSQVKALSAKVDSIKAGGATVDYDKLANKVADVICQRMKA